MLCKTAPRGLRLWLPLMTRRLERTHDSRFLVQDATIAGDATCSAREACHVSPHPVLLRTMLVSIAPPHHTDTLTRHLITLLRAECRDRWGRHVHY
jgi:hypothetical protein